MTIAIGRAVRRVALAGTLVVIPESVLAEGFGSISKTIVRLSRTNPPEVFLPPGRVAFRTSGDREVAGPLAAKLESQLLSADKRLSRASGVADVIVEVTIVRNDPPSRQDVLRKEYDSQRVTGPNGKVSVKPQEVMVRYVDVKHTLGVTFRITQTRGGINVASGTIEIPYQESFREGVNAPAPAELVSRAVDATVVQLVAQLTYTREEIPVLIPEGSLKSAGRFAEAGLWNKYLEALQLLPPRPKPGDEAYRSFALGLAHEALGYATSEDAEAALNYLEQAQALYNKALEMNPEEKLFREPYSGGFLAKVRMTSSKSATAPLDRIRESLVRYQKLKETVVTYAAAKGGSSATTGSKAIGPELSEKKDGVFDNDAILAMVEAGVAEDVIVAAIDSAPESRFDVSAAGLIQLSQGGVPRTLLKHIQAVATKARRRPK